MLKLELMKALVLEIDLEPWIVETLEKGLKLLNCAIMTAGVQFSDRLAGYHVSKCLNHSLGLLVSPPLIDCRGTVYHIKTIEITL